MSIVDQPVSRLHLQDETHSWASRSRDGGCDPGARAKPSLAGSRAAGPHARRAPVDRRPTAGGDKQTRCTSEGPRPTVQGSGAGWLARVGDRAVCLRPPYAQGWEWNFATFWQEWL